MRPPLIRGGNGNVEFPDTMGDDASMRPPLIRGGNTHPDPHPLQRPCSFNEAAPDQGRKSGAHLRQESIAGSRFNEAAPDQGRKCKVLRHGYESVNPASMRPP